MPSRLFIYYNERVMEGTVEVRQRRPDPRRHQERRQTGACPETTGPTTSPGSRQAAQDGYTEAKKHKVVLYQRVMQTLTQLKGCLASGFPFVFGFTVYESFESPQVAKTGHAPMPTAGREAARRPCGARGRLRRDAAALHRAQLVGPQLGDGRLLHDALPVPAPGDALDDLWTIRPSKRGHAASRVVPSGNADEHHCYVRCQADERAVGAALGHCSRRRSACRPSSSARTFPHLDAAAAEDPPRRRSARALDPTESLTFYVAFLGVLDPVSIRADGRVRRGLHRALGDARDVPRADAVIVRLVHIAKVRRTREPFAARVRYGGFVGGLHRLGRRSTATLLRDFSGDKIEIGGFIVLADDGDDRAVPTRWTEPCPTRSTTRRPRARRDDPYVASARPTATRIV